MSKGLMIHYLPVLIDNNWSNDIAADCYKEYKETITEAHPEFKHIFFPSQGREGVEIASYPSPESEEKKVL